MNTDSYEIYLSAVRNHLPLESENAVTGDLTTFTKGKCAWKIWQERYRRSGV